MQPNPTSIQRYALPAYLVLTPLISVAIPLLLPGSVELAVLLMLLVPALMAMILTAVAEGMPALARLLGKLFQWRASLVGYGLALSLPVVMVVAVHAARVACAARRTLLQRAAQLRPRTRVPIDSPRRMRSSTPGWAMSKMRSGMSASRQRAKAAVSITCRSLAMTSS